jgi:hypothetical protein
MFNVNFLFFIVFCVIYLGLYVQWLTTSEDIVKISRVYMYNDLLYHISLYVQWSTISYLFICTMIYHIISLYMYNDLLLYHIFTPDHFAFTFGSLEKEKRFFSYSNDLQCSRFDKWHNYQIMMSFVWGYMSLMCSRS